MKMTCDKYALLLTLTFLGLISVSLCTFGQERACEVDNCPVGQRCVLRQVQCVRAPCYPQPTCVPRGRFYKPGSCPRRRPGLVGPCVVNCFGDSSCPGNQKCCGSCPKDCVTPELPNGEKPGSCPARSTNFGICVARCTFDRECPGDQKCCGGCPRECKAPARTKPGHCPPRLLGGFRGAWCRSAPSEVCTNDYECDGSQKCCDNGCHSACTRPYYNDREA